MNLPDDKSQPSVFNRLKHRIIGKPRDINEPSLFHKLSLIPVLAWIGLGGGGYVVATHTISRQAGVISGSALLVDYVLTIAISLASCGDAIFSFLPPAFLHYKMFFVVGLIFVLILNSVKGDGSLSSLRLF